MRPFSPPLCFAYVAALFPNPATGQRVFAVDRRVMIVVAMRSAEGCYHNVCRYLAGVMPVARRNARVKLDSEENRQS